MKVIAFYLPQFHEIPENDRWWGEGFTEWVNVRNAVPLFEGHHQPRVPLGRRYYNLLDDDVKIWQSSLARKYGVYGFCYYHYWFGGKLLLQKPMEQMLANKAVNLPFCICWANEAWTRAWTGGTETLIPQRYGGEHEWRQHFEYLLPFMRDDRYIRVDGKPLLIIYRPEVISCLEPMLKAWRQWARETGLTGLTVAFQQFTAEESFGFKHELFDWDIEFQPSYASKTIGLQVGPLKGQAKKALRQAKQSAFTLYERLSGVDLDRGIRFNKANKAAGRPYILEYDECWQQILETGPIRENSIPGAYVGWDNTPRYGASGSLHTGATPARFEEYMAKQIRRARDIYNSDYLFLTAWNEWAEGSVLEPDEENRYGYLEALRNALRREGEFESTLI